MKLIFTSFIAAAYAGLTCNQDGSADFTFAKGSGHLDTFKSGSCTNENGKLTSSEAGGQVTINVGKDCFGLDGLSRTADLTTYYSLTDQLRMIFKSVDDSVKCEILDSYEADLEFNVEIDHTTNSVSVSDKGFAFDVKRFKDSSFNEEESDTFVKTGETVYFKVVALKTTDGYSYEVPNCKIVSGADEYDLWKLNDASYCIESFAATSLNADWEASFTTFGFQTEDNQDYKITCSVKVCLGDAGCGHVSNCPAL